MLRLLTLLLRLLTLLLRLLTLLLRLPTLLLRLPTLLLRLPTLLLSTPRLLPLVPHLLLLLPSNSGFRNKKPAFGPVFFSSVNRTSRQVCQKPNGRSGIGLVRRRRGSAEQQAVDARDGLHQTR